MFVSNGPKCTNQIYLWDLWAGSNILVSKSYATPAPGNDRCDSPTISCDDRFIAYRSAASNLVPNDTNGVPDIFLYDRLTGGTTLVSVSMLGAHPANSRSLNPVFSGDGHTLFFQSWASDLAAGDFNQGSDVFALALNSASPIASTNGPQPLQLQAIALGTTNAGVATVVGSQGQAVDAAPDPAHRFYRIVSQ